MGEIGGWVSHLLAWLLGAIAFEAIRHSLMRRPEFARRRDRFRSLAISGYLAVVVGLLVALFAVLAATSGDAAHLDDAMIFAGIAGGLVALGAGLLIAWWRLAGRPPHS